MSWPEILVIGVAACYAALCGVHLYGLAVGVYELLKESK